MAKKVLVVDDEKLIVKGIRFSLEQDGMEVDCAYDGEEAYEKANGGKITVEVQQSDSTTGITSAAEGICDIGMASRELKDEETSENLTATEIARDGIAVVVNNDNDIDNLTSDQVKAIFTGETTEWEDLAK